MNLQDVVIAELLRPHEARGIGDTLIMVAIVSGALFALVAFEYALFTAARRIFRTVRKAWESTSEAPPPS
jgi:hypothetical protein